MASRCDEPMTGDLTRIVMVYVDSYENDVPQGRFCIAANQEIMPFRSLIQLLKKVDAEFDEAKFPQAFERIRQFHEPEEQPGSGETSIDARPGKIATFAIRILFRQNASWQGSVRWMEGGQEESFRSVFELIMLIDNALGYAKKK